MRLTGQETLKPIGSNVEYLKPGKLVVYKRMPFIIDNEPEFLYEQGKTKIGDVKLKDAEYGDLAPTIYVNSKELFMIVKN